MHDLISDQRLYPTKEEEKSLFIQLFLLERELDFAQKSLNRIHRLEKVQPIIMNMLNLVEGMPKSTICNINPLLQERYQQLLTRFRKTLDLFILEADSYT
ncbi:hypothetical protein ACK14O_14375 [Vibrio harveyi]|uniref:hypothetical protein n=1 Tax=Vibrio harveyi TaxID=669 RepID=UPI00390BA8B7